MVPATKLPSGLEMFKFDMTQLDECDVISLFCYSRK